MTEEIIIGKPRHFDVNLHISAIEQMILADEVGFALQMLENIPGYYRENPHPMIEKVKMLLHKAIVTPVWYATQTTELDFKMARESFDCSYPRAHATLSEIQALNEQGIMPTLIDLAPGCFMIPIGCLERGAKFRYMPITMNHKALEKLKEEFPQMVFTENPCEHSIFCAYEIIEHLWFPQEIKQYVLRTGVWPRTIMLSTPKYTFGFPAHKWWESQLGHLRTYTKKEFFDYGEKTFPNYKWSLMDEEILLLVGRLNETDKP